jgi:hypothetical protein
MTIDSLFTQIRAVRVGAGFEDPAVDMAKTPIVKYLESRDLTDVVLVEGATPDVFVLNRLSHSMMMNLIDRNSSRDLQALLAFSAGCHRIECGDGTVMEPKEFHTGKEKVAKESWAAEVAAELDLPCIIEMGELILKFSKMGKRSKRAFF